MATMFDTFPLDGERMLSSGERVSTPYHIYDGSILLIGGTADLKAATALLKADALIPISTASGRALIAIWMCDFTRANLGAHHELQISIFVSQHAIEPLRDNRFAILEAMTIHPEIYMMCHGLWNDTATVVAYNRELLGLNASLISTRIEDRDGTRRFHVEQAGKDILSGQVLLQQRQAPGAAVALLRAFSLGDFMRISAMRWLSVRVANSISEASSENCLAWAHAAGSKRMIRPYRPRNDHLDFGDTPYRNLDFQPDFVYQLEGCNFVYLMPERLS